MNRFKNISLIVRIYALVLVIFSVFRLILFFTETGRINLDDDQLSTILYAFIMGVRFDIVITGYLMAIPAVILLVLDIINKNHRYIYRFVFYWTFILFMLSFIVCAADIPYFNQFFSRFSISAFEWMDNPAFVFGMIIQEPKYFLFFIPLFILVFLFYRQLRKIFRKEPSPVKTALYLKVLVSVVFLGLMFLGIRGRVQKKSPIRIGTAYFSNNAFLNQLGLNPVFTLMRSYLDSQNEENKIVQVMDNQEAIIYVQKELGITHPDKQAPIAREVVPDSVSETKPNVIFIIMESMSAAKMTRHGNPNNLTPFLDSIANESYYFENIYTSGKHTFNGIFSTLFSFPALYRQHPMKQIKQYNGISYALHQHGYSTTYFCTHDGQFDNVEGFLRANDFDNIITQSDYPLEKIKTTLGVPDDYMFEFSMAKLDQLNQESSPFFATFMTASDHGPYYIPEYFSPRAKDIKQQIVEYADWSLRKFITMASKKEWFDNTIFMFVADHGAPIAAPYDISLDYHHSPLIFYAPTLLPEAKSFDKIGGQIDIFPTTMGLLNLPYINNTLGINLFKENRSYILINDDDKIGVLNQENLLIMREGEISKLYKYQDADKTNYYPSHQDKALEMEKYAKANMQIFQYLLLHNYTYLK